jgi:two-component system, LuxR family, response regulator FixJ
MDNEPTVFVVDDDPAARGSVAALVASHGLKVESFASAEEFLAARDPAQRGCLIADVRMAGMSGLELQERLVARGDRLPVIIITGFADIPMAVRAMQAGAITFLEKPCADQELWQSIQAALDSEEQAESNRQKRADVIARRESLTPAEVDVLERILAGKPNKQMAAELGVGLRTVELRRATLIKKMRADSLPELVQLVLIAQGKSPEAKPPEGAVGEEAS